MDQFNEIISELKNLAKAETETALEIRRQNEQAEKSLSLLMRQLTAEQQRVKMAFDTQDMVSGLIVALEEVFNNIDFIKKMIKELDRRSERTDDILLVLLTEKSGEMVLEVLEDLTADIALRETNQRKLLRTHKKNLASLKQQAAFHGQQVPLRLINEIEAEQKAIADLEKALEKKGDRKKTGTD